MTTFCLKNKNLPDAGFSALQRAVCRILERRGLGLSQERAEFSVCCGIDGTLSDDRYIISVNGADFSVTAANLTAVFAGVGRLMTESSFDGRGGYTPPQDLPIDHVPAKPLRGMYFATHFHNFYHAAPMEKVREVIEDLALRGYNSLLVWFDMHHYTSVNDPDAREMIARLRQILTYANTLGMGGSLTMLSNEAFAGSPEELRADWRVQGGYHHTPDGHYHLEICPSKPGGLEKILEYRRQVLEQFQDLKIDYVVYWPYDQGGCTCKDCEPWGANGFLKLLPHFQRLLKEVMPETKIILSTWYFDKFIDGEWDAFYPRLTDGTLKDIPYVMSFFFGGELPRCIAEKGIPEGVKFVDFPEISMYSCVPWGGYGASHLARFLNETNTVCSELYQGGFPYSEGVFEDANKFIQAGSYTGVYPNAFDALRAYVKFEFCCDDEALYEAIRDTEIALAREHDFKAVPFRARILDSSRAQQVLEILEQYNKTLPPAITAARPFRLFYLRAVIDAEMCRNDGIPTRSERCVSALQELARHYHVTPETNRHLFPPYREKLC